MLKLEFERTGLVDLRVSPDSEAELAALGREGWAVVAAFGAAGTSLVLSRPLPFAPRLDERPRFGGESPFAPSTEAPPEVAAEPREPGIERLGTLAKEARARRKRER